MTLHADDNAVSLLSMAMTTKLRKMRTKGRAGWDSESCSQQHLSNLLRAAVEKGDTVDVANYCAFLLARVESILPAEQPKPVASGGWMEQLGFEVRQYDDMLRIVVDDCGNEREATLTERVLWDALMAASAEFAEAPQAPAAPVDDLAQLVKQLVRALRKALPGNDLADKALDYLKRQGLQGSPLRATPEAPQTHAGLLAAAAHIQAKAQAHLDERGSYDPDTGAVEMSESNQEHFNTLDELAEELRELADKSAQAACDKPPAGWTCSRAPGHDGPCAAAPAAPAVDALGERDAAFEAVRKRLCGLQRYSFVLDDDGVVRRAQDRTGNWIEFDDAHALFDPVAVDAARAAQAKEGGEAC